MKLFDNEIIELYAKGMSSLSIVEKMSEKYPSENWYPQKILRIVKKNGQVRDFKEAQAMALSSGRATHPTEGKQRTKEEREKISVGYDSFYNGLSEEDMALHAKEKSDRAKKEWTNRTEEEKASMMSVLNASRVGCTRGKSKAEISIFNELKKRGHQVMDKYVYDKSGEEIDLLVGKNFAIEVDGPVHWKKIYDEDTLKKRMAKDEIKNKKLSGAGFFVLRVRIKSLQSKRKLRNCIDKIEEWMYNKSRDRVTFIEEI